MTSTLDGQITGKISGNFSSSKSVKCSKNIATATKIHLEFIIEVLFMHLLSGRVSNKVTRQEPLDRIHIPVNFGSRSR